MKQEYKDRDREIEKRAKREYEEQLKEIEKATGHTISEFCVRTYIDLGSEKGQILYRKNKEEKILRNEKRIMDRWIEYFLEIYGRRNKRKF